MKRIIGIAIVLTIAGGAIAMVVITAAMQHGIGTALALVGIMALLLFGAWLAASDD